MNTNACTDIELISSRTIPSFDGQPPQHCLAKEVLFRAGEGFVLYRSNGAPGWRLKEKIVRLAAREALIWLDGDPNDAGAFWDEAD